MRVGVRILLALMLAALFAGCAAKHLPDGVTSDMVVSSAKDTLRLLHERDYESVAESFREDLRGQVSENLFRDELDGRLVELGDFRDYKEILVAGEMSVETYVEAVSCFALCEYENGEQLYRVIFDDSMNLIGLFTM